MKTNAEIVNNVFEKTKKLRKKRNVRTAITSVSLSALLFFLVSFSNIIPVNAGLFTNSYKKYLAPYATTQSATKLTASGTSDELPEATLRFIDENNAVVSLDGAAYPCLIKAKSAKRFQLTSTAEEKHDSQNNETPSVFNVEFWNNKAELSFTIGGVKITKILSVTQEKQIPTGLWITHATQSEDEETPHPVSGGGWTLILDNGKSYTGEGRDSAYLSQFISVNDILLQCLFDSKSGIILDASVCIYDTTTFDFPTLKERYLSDGEVHYFYSRLLADKEKINFNGGAFNATGVIYSAEDFKINKNELVHESMASWQLFPNSSCENHLLDLTAKLDLSANGTAFLAVTGNVKFNGKTTGKWYPLKDSVLVVLNESAKLTGRLFTIFPNTQSDKTPTAEDLQNYALTSLDTYDFYKVGYHVFQYRTTEEETKIFWGNAWKKEHLARDIIYEQTYVFYGKYLPAYYNDPDFNQNNPKDTTLQDLPLNGLLEVVFHEDGTATFTNLQTGESWLETYLHSHENLSITFPNKTLLYQGERSNYYAIKLSYINRNYGYLDYEGTIIVTATNDGIHHYTKFSYTYFYISLILKP